MDQHEGVTMSDGEEEMSDFDDHMDDSVIPSLKRKIISHSDKEKDECGEIDQDIRTQQHLQLLRQAEAAALMGLQQPFGFPSQFHTSLQAQFQAQLQAFAQQQQSFGSQAWMNNGQPPPIPPPNNPAALYAQSIQAQIARNQGVIPNVTNARPPECSPLSQNNGSGGARSEPSSPPSPRSIIGSSMPNNAQIFNQMGNRSFISRSSPRPSLTPSPSNESPQNDPSRNTGGSSQQSWTFEEQFKQLYELTENPKRKAFLDELFDFMQKRGTPITRLPIMAKHVLDLYELYNLVVARGGLVDVINKKLWQEIIKGLNLPSSITSAAFTLRTQYMKYLYPFECEKDKFSTPPELQTAIDGNRREGRRSSYGAFGEMGAPRGPGMQLPGGLSQLASQMQMSPMSLVSRPPLMNGGHNPHHPHPGNRGSPPTADALQALEMQRLNLWNLYSSALTGDVTNTSEPPSSASHMAALAAMAGGRFIPQQKEALNLAAEQARQDALKLRASEAAQRISKEERQEVKKESAEKREAEEPRLPLEYSAEKKKREIHWKMAVTEGQDNQTNQIQITVTSRGVESRNSTEGQLIATFEFDGVVYQGPLFAQGHPSSTV